MTESLFCVSGIIVLDTDSSFRFLFVNVLSDSSIGLGACDTFAELFISLLCGSGVWASILSLGVLTTGSDSGLSAGRFKNEVFARLLRTGVLKVTGSNASKSDFLWRFNCFPASEIWLLLIFADCF